LSKLECALGRNMIYCDTDSAYHASLRDPPYVTGFKTGDLELELKHGQNWRGLGRKSYVYEKPGEKYVVRQKGVVINLKTHEAFNLRDIDSLIMNTWRFYHDTSFNEQGIPLLKKSKKNELKWSEYEAEIISEQRMFITETNKLNEPHKRTVYRQKKTRFNVFAPKRVICWRDWENDSHVLDTVPFGYLI